MTNNWLWPTIVLVLIALTPAAADTIYSDGWEPPRLVDGVWVTSGVADEVAQEYAASREQERLAEQASWQQWYSTPPPDWSDEWMFNDPDAWWTKQPGAHWGSGLTKGLWLVPGQPPIAPGAWMFNGPGLTATNPFYQHWFNSFYPEVMKPGVQGFAPSRLGPAVMPNDYPTVGP